MEGPLCTATPFMSTTETLVTVLVDYQHHRFCKAMKHCFYDYDYDYIMAPQRGRPYGANLGSMGRNTGTWSIRSECLSNITSWSRRKE